MSMIHFDFVVTALEAEDIFDALNDEIAELLHQKVMSDNPLLWDWYDERVAYLKELKTKMKNTAQGE